MTKALPPDLAMVRRADGQHVGVEVVPERAMLLGTYPACLSIHSGDFGSGLIQFRMAIGLFNPFTGPAGDHLHVVVVAMRQDLKSPIRLVATQSAGKAGVEDIELYDLPREITFDELLRDGRLWGRFEGAIWEDIKWYFDYCVDHEGNWPATNISFPSAEGPGLDDRQGAVREGKAVAVTAIG
jgi:hypothetical protein